MTKSNKNNLELRGSLKNKLVIFLKLNRKGKQMAKDGYQKEVIQNVAIIRNLLILLLEKLDVKKEDIAKTINVTPGRLSQILNPGKYKK